MGRDPGVRGRGRWVTSIILRIRGWRSPGVGITIRIVIIIIVRWSPSRPSRNTVPVRSPYCSSWCWCNHRYKGRRLVLPRSDAAVLRLAYSPDYCSSAPRSDYSQWSYS
ncbi:hypothetical protein AGDE_15244 [Angomonas deanei]|uniref:Uncharacterized protein n=1 Tax=Angomonas deanei TaxID=59799 RepID=A0A7G2CEL0_9TRYP|nr:hypothetical protein AGDE_15244 [Angomonas deanei]CAD2217304.1 hypothetical protein, conserved [Angomonas deanei]|eukprot:EPY19424.1 hypothetical protein AGDE_15244 [Angomonas deanei]